MYCIDVLAILIIICSWIFQIKNPNYTSPDLSRFKNLIPYTRDFDMNTEK